ncbi:MFS transporter [Actinomadura sp. ATCC 31491]|uniref:MFS transporter n=1 Tax=Actinomadura luzonensis TaxID=2805427 RepID=A0ABT0FSX2_9ACTN|nr:MFS transporter [Actinomadura luzonensis]MCK2215432.1 MFS transporter [Actinomadura luzonensis]
MNARRRLAAVLVAAGIMNIAYTMLIPLVPELTGRLGMDAASVGLAFAGFALAKALTQPLGGLLADALPRRPAWAAAGWLVAAAAAVAATGHASTGPALVALRLLWGAAEGFAMPPLYRLVTALSRRAGLGAGRAFGWFGGAAVSGMALGPVLVGLLRPVLGFSGVFLAGRLASFTLAGALLVAAAGRAAEGPADAPRPAEPAPAAPARGPLVALVVVFGLTDLVSNAVYAALEPTLPLHLDRLGGDGLRLTAALFGLGLVVFAVAAPWPAGGWPSGCRRPPWARRPSPWPPRARRAGGRPLGRAARRRVPAVHAHPAGPVRGGPPRRRRGPRGRARPGVRRVRPAVGPRVHRGAAGRGAAVRAAGRRRVRPAGRRRRRHGRLPVRGAALRAPDRAVHEATRTDDP